MAAILRRFVYLIIIFSISASTMHPVLACGPYTVDPVFGFTKHGEYPLNDFSGGKLGIVPNSYGRISLYVYYRYLNDMPFDKAEKKEVARAIRNRIGFGAGTAEDTSGINIAEKPNAASVWIETSKPIRAIYDGAKDPEDDALFNERQGPYYTSYLGCLDDAYLTASRTLKLRLSSGHDRKDIADWVAGQDAVFSNCGEDGKFPAAAPSGSPQWLRKDRDYQLAAALFYRQKHADARNAFELISQDAASPWSKISYYLVARTYIREASFVEPEENGSDQTESAYVQRNSLLANAASRLNKIIDDPELSEFHNSSRNLLGLVKYRLDPAKRTVELARRLSDGKPNTNIYNDLTDYIWLLDKIELRAQNAGKKPGDPDYSDWYHDPDYDLRLGDVPASDRAEDITNWLMAYQAEDGFEHALENWKSTSRVQWLVAAITKAPVNHPAAERLVLDAKTLNETSPAFYTAMYHAIRISIHSGNKLEAQKLTDRVFSAGFEKIPIASKNSFYSQRLESAPDLASFLKYANRTPTSFLWSGDFNEAGTKLTVNEGLPSWKDKQMFGEDAVNILNTSVPLSVWLDAAVSEEVPDHLRDFIASAGWIRAFLLKDALAEFRFSKLMSKYSKDYSPLMQSYYRARSSRDRESSALMAIGRYAVLEPFVAARWGRKTSDPKTIDSNRGNWWCLSQAPVKDIEKPAFLSPADYAKGKAEHSALRALGEGSTAFAARALDFAKRNPGNRRTPEILHLAVRATRYGCRDDRTGSLSKEAFDLLHRRYKNSTWTKRTPYWYS